MFFFILLIISIGLTIWYFSRSANTLARHTGLIEVENTNDNQNDIANQNAITQSTEDYYEMGDPTRVDDDAWCLNPKGTFPITITDVNREIVLRVKEILQKGFTGIPKEIADELLPILFCTHLRWKEFDEYIEEFKPLYLKKTESLKASSNEWSMATEDQQQILLKDFQDQAVKSIPVRPYCNLKLLLDLQPTIDPLVEEFVSKYGFEIFKIYSSYEGGQGIVEISREGDFRRQDYDRLLEVGLAHTGETVSVSDMLKALKLKEINFLCRDLVTKSFRRRVDAETFLSRLPDASERIGSIISKRDVFQLDPLPEKYLQIDWKIQRINLDYLREVALLLDHSYSMCGYATRRKKENFALDESSVVQWELQIIDVNSCPFCVNASKRTFSFNEYPLTPFHVGCRCSVLPVLRDS